MKKILFLDDDKFILKAIKRKLRKINVDIYFESEEKNAEILIREIDFDEIFIDYNLKEMTAIEFINRNKDNIKCNIYILSGDIINKPEYIKEVLKKPIDYKRIVEIIKE